MNRRIALLIAGTAFLPVPVVGAVAAPGPNTFCDQSIFDFDPATIKKSYAEANQRWVTELNNYKTELTAKQLFIKRYHETVSETTQQHMQQARDYYYAYNGAQKLSQWISALEFKIGGEEVCVKNALE